MSNPTSNYNFQMPTATDLVTDLPADFEVFGQAVDTRLKALQPGTTLGDLAYSSATANTNTRLAIGTTGQVLAVSGGVPAWTTVASGGKIKQVVSATYSTQVANATNTYADTNLTATITPTASNSTILVMVTQPYVTNKGAQEVGIDIQLMRGATVIHNPPSGANTFFIGGSAGANAWSNIEHMNIFNLTYVDSPATTSATTYKTQFKAPYAGTIQVQKSGYTATITLLEVGA